jgi:hypothetical protein
MDDQIVTKKFWKSKLFWIGVLVTIGGILEYVDSQPVEVSIPTMIAGVITIITRALTSEAITW